MEKISKKSVGEIGENIAVKYLINHGFNVLCKNFRYSKLGEIDIIAAEKEYICFVEVKTRTCTTYGIPSESVNIKKQKKIKSLAQIYLNSQAYTDKNIRFDIVEIYLEYSRRDKKIIGLRNINLIRNAF